VRVVFPLIRSDLFVYAQKYNKNEESGVVSIKNGTK
jgi:hypothetical protein